MSRIQVAGLVKWYGKRIRALNAVSFTVPEGTIFGLLGPNGSGKTTLVKVLAGIITDFRGEVLIDGLRLPSREAARFIGYMPQASALYNELTVRENLEFFGAVNGLRDNRNRRRAIDALLGVLDLSGREDTVVAELSGGLKQRTSLGCALLHRPPLLLLDEPTIGLDPRLRLQFWDYFRVQAASGTTILITTHIYEEARNCTRLGLLREGELIAQGSAGELQREAGTDDLERAFLYFMNHAVSGDGR